MGLDTNTYWLTDRPSQCDFDFDLNSSVCNEQFSREDMAVRTEDFACATVYDNLRQWLIAEKSASARMD
jgi:hypothetical protein